MARRERISPGHSLGSRNPLHTFRQEAAYFLSRNPAYLRSWTEDRINKLLSVNLAAILLIFYSCISIL